MNTTNNKKPYQRPVCVTIDCHSSQLLNTSSDTPFVREENGYIIIDYTSIETLGDISDAI